MQNLQKIDEYLFKLINSTGWQQIDEIMILNIQIISSRNFNRSQKFILPSQIGRFSYIYIIKRL